MNHKKLARALREKREALRRQATREWSWTRYLKGVGVRKVGVVGLAKMLNKGELHGKTVVQTDFDLSEPAKNAEELEGLHATDLYFLVMENETAERIMVLGLP